VVYSLTEKAIELVPIMAIMGSWGIKHATPSPELSARAQVLEDGGPSYGMSSSPMEAGAVGKNPNLA
jgi:hypothetical protein